MSLEDIFLSLTTEDTGAALASPPPADAPADPEPTEAANA